MRHGIAGNTLNRKTAHRKATVRDIAKSTLIRQRISTTKVKAKEARKLVDQLITLGKKGTLADKRRAFAILCDHKLVSELFDKIAPRFKERKGGYTRIILAGNRRGDNAELVYLELTEKEQIILKKVASKDKKVKAVSEDKTVVEPKETKEAKTKVVSSKPEKESKAKAKTTGGLGKIFKKRDSK